MRNLTGAEIEKLASRAGVRRIAVENFLSTLDERAGVYGNQRNANDDARVYKWTAATQGAIRAGIKLAFK